MLVLAALTARVSSWAIRPLRLASRPGAFVKRVVAGAAFGAAVVLSPMDNNALALSSGARVGGSSFSAPSSYHYTPTYSAPSYQYTPTYITPIYSGSSATASQSGTTHGEMSDSLFRVYCGIIGTLVFSLVYLTTISLIDVPELNRRRITVVKLQLSLKSDWKAVSGDWRKVLMDELWAYAALNKPPTTSADFAELLKESTRRIRRYEDDFESVSCDLREFFWRPSEAEKLFVKWSVEERSKFETETTPSPALAMFHPSLIGKQTPTKAVVTVIYAVRGSNDGLKGRVKAASSASARKANVQDLLVAMTLDGDNYNDSIVGCELLWSPSVRGTVVTDEEIALEFPHLKRLL